jgi:hypothetical protein
MNKTLLSSGAVAICLFLVLAGGVFGGIEPSPFKHDILAFQKKIDPSRGRLAEAKPGADLTKLGLMKYHADMTQLWQSMEAKVKGLMKTKGQEKGIIITCNKMKPQLDNLELLLKNYGAAIKRSDKLAAQESLAKIEETVKALEALIKK